MRGVLRLTLVALVLGLLAAPAAQATYPGANGKILMVRYDPGIQDYELWSINPDGSGATNLTNTPTVDETTGRWSPDGTKIVFIVYPGVWVMNADGTGRTEITPDVSGAPFYNAHVQPTTVAWSPDGAKIAISNRDGCGPNHGPGQVIVVNTDGSNPTQVVCHWPPEIQTVKGAGASAVHWSPDGMRLTFGGPYNPACMADAWVVNRDGTGLTDITQGNGGDETPVDWSPNGARIETFEDYCGTDQDEAPWTMNPDGTGRVRVTQPPTGFLWSPNYTKITYGSGTDVWVANVDGSDPVNITNNTPSTYDGPTDWLAIPQNAYPRPKGATPTRVSFTTAYNQCTATDRTHGPPLAFGSCSSPQKSSQYLTVGTGDANGKPALNEGSLTMSVMPGVPGGVDDTDVGLTFSMDDVFTNALADYTGELRASIPLRITDKDNTPNPGGPGAATLQETTLDMVVPCAPVADPNEGSSCSSNTSVDAVIPGAATEGKRGVWALGRIAVYDGGADSDGDTPAGDTLFATQGIFVP